MCRVEWDAGKCGQQFGFSMDENEQAGLCACSGVVAQAIKSAQIVTYAAHEKYEFPLAYAEYERVQNNIYGEPTWRVEANYAEGVTVTLIAPAADATLVRAQVTAMTGSDAYITPIEVLWLPLRE